MMRTTLFVILALLVTGSGFTLYWKLQDPIARLQGQGPPPEAQSIDNNAKRVGGVSSGEQPWSKKFDGDGRLTYKFRSDTMEPRGNGKVHVTNPVAEFYQYARERDPDAPTKFKTRVQLIQINGQTGDMEIQDSNTGGAPTMGKGSGGAPRRGRLNQVVVHLYHDMRDRDRELNHIPATQPSERAEPTLTLVSDNVVFDNESFELSTEAFRGPDGTIVPADQVPIQVTGDYDFRGRGLRMRWNQVDGRLEYLEVAHGEVLKINHPSVLQKSQAASPTVATAGPTELLPDGSVSDAFGRQVQPASTERLALSDARRPLPATLVKDATTEPKPKPRPADKSAPPKHPGAKGKSEPKGPQPPYRATFLEQVHITQGEENVSERETARSDLMFVDFQPAQNNGSKPTTAPSTSQPAGAPNAARPTTQPAAPSTPSTNPSVASGNTTPGQSFPTTGPSTKPSDPDSDPVIVRWVGPLKVVPIEPDDPQGVPHLKPGESILRLVAQDNPVIVTRQQSDALCSSLDYHSADGSVLLHSSPKYPTVVLTQYPPAGTQELPSVVTTESLLYSGIERVALLSGKGRALMAVHDGKPTTRPAVEVANAARPVDDRMDARWTRAARLHFGPGAADLREGMAIRHATLLGDVDIKHPQLNLDSQALELFFEPELASLSDPAPTTRPASKQPTLRQAIATDTVKCRLTDAEGKKQNIECDKLTLATSMTADGKLYPKLVNADGQAHAYDLQQDLKAKHIELTLAPATKGAGKPKTAGSTTPAAETAPGGIDTAAVELRTMTAKEEVHVVSADGAIATGAELYVTQIDGMQHARLVGGPLAEVIDAKKNIVRGPEILVDPQTNIAHVVGRGNLTLMRQDSPTDTPRKTDVAFIEGADVDGPANRIWVRGPVAVVSPDADGSVSTATGNRVTIELADRPPDSLAHPAKNAPAQATAAQPSPTVQPSAVAQPSAAMASSATLSASTDPRSTTRPSQSLGAPGDGLKMNMMSNKEAKTIILEQDAVVRSSLTADDGSILREFELKSAIIRYELLPTPVAATYPSARPATTQPAPKAGRIVVPGAGTMLVRDHRPPEAHQATQPAAADPMGTGNQRGAMAFQWAGGMVYDETVRAASMNQDVIIVQRPDDPKSPPARLDADHVTAWFEPKPKVAVAGAPIPTQPATTANTGQQLKWLTARGHANATREGNVLSADRIDYDPASFWMTATGTDRTAATFYDPTGAKNANADQILWNTQTWRVQARNLTSHATTAEKTPVRKK